MNRKLISFVVLLSLVLASCSGGKSGSSGSSGGGTGGGGSKRIHDWR